MDSNNNQAPVQGQPQAAPQGTPVQAQAAPQGAPVQAQQAAPQGTPVQAPQQPLFNQGAPVSAQAPAQNVKKKKEVTNEKLYKAIIFNRVLMFFMIFLMIIFIVIACIVFYRVNVLINEIQPIIDLIETIDLEGINNVLKELESIFGAVDWDKTAEALSKFDVDAVNDMVSAFDINKLNTAIDNINSAYKTMEDISNKLQPLINFFGGNR